MKKSVLIAGATGLLGQHLCRLIAPTHTVYALVHPDKQVRSAFPESVQLLPMDLRTPNLDQLPQHVDAVVYLAQSPRFREFPAGSVDMVQVNVSTPVVLAEWAVRAGATSFMYASSGGIYGAAEKPAKEDHPIMSKAPINFYLDSKRSAELLLSHFGSLFEGFKIIRPFFMYGPGQHVSMLIPRIITNVKACKPISLDGEHGIHSNPIFATDAARAVSHILWKPGMEIYNIAGEEQVSLRHIAETAGMLVGVEPIFEVQPRKDNVLGDISKLKEAGFKFNVSFQEGLKQTIESLG